MNRVLGWPKRSTFPNSTPLLLEPRRPRPRQLGRPFGKLDPHYCSKPRSTLGNSTRPTPLPTVDLSPIPRPQPSSKRSTVANSPPSSEQRGRAPDGIIHALRGRQQAFTLLIRAYTSLRRAARFLYPTREADRRVPSLYVKRRREQHRRASLPGATSA
jgi:hypothetical protein